MQASFFMMTFRPHNKIMKCSVVILALMACVPISSPAYAVPVADTPVARVMSDQYLQEAKTLLDAGKAEEAWEMLRHALRSDPANVAVNLLLVRAAFATGRDNQALGALERAVALVPESAELRYALAQAYARAGDAVASAAELEEAERIKPGIAAEDAKKVFEKIARAEQNRYKRFQAAGRLALGFVWDSNATIAPDSRNIEIGPWNFRLHDNAEKKAALGEYASGSLNWGWRLGEDSPFHVAGDLAFYGKTFNRDLPSNSHFTWGTASLGLRYTGGKNLFDLRGRIENASYDPFENMTSTGGEALWVYAPVPALQFITRGGVASRVYMEDDGRNGAYVHGGMYVRWLADAAGKFSLLGGGRYLGMRAEEARSSYDGWDCILRAEIALAENLTMAPYIGWRELFYHGAATPLSEWLGEENRQDHTLMTGVSFTYNFTENIGVEVGWQYFKNHSASQIYRYDQHQINTGLVFSF